MKKNRIPKIFSAKLSEKFFRNRAKLAKHSFPRESFNESFSEYLKKGMKGLFLLILLFGWIGAGCQSKTENKNVQKSSSESAARPVPIKKPSDVKPISIPTETLVEIFGNTDPFAEEGNNKPISQDLNVSDDVKQEWTNQLLNADPNRPQIIRRTENTASENESAPRFLLQYKFVSGEQIRWKVVHQTMKKLTYQNETKSVETISESIKRWNVCQEVADGKVLCEHLIDKVSLKQRQSKESLLKKELVFDDWVSYNSETDLGKVPAEFARFEIDKTVGVRLERFMVDHFGMLSSKTKLVPQYHGAEGESKVFIPFPSEAVAVGESWTIPYPIIVQKENKTQQVIQAVQRFTLESVQGNVATIRLGVTLLHIINDPIIEGQLAEKIYSGKARFDLEQGKIVRQELTFSRSVANAMGPASYLEYTCRVQEELASLPDRVAMKPTSENQSVSDMLFKNQDTETNGVFNQNSGNGNRNAENGNRNFGNGSFSPQTAWGETRQNSLGQTPPAGNFGSLQPTAVPTNNVQTNNVQTNNVPANNGNGLNQVRNNGFNNSGINGQQPTYQRGNLR